MSSKQRRALRIPLRTVEEGVCQLPESSGRFLARVHRLGVGDPVVCFDPEHGAEAHGRVFAVDGRRVMVELGRVRRATNVSSWSVTLLQAVAKGEKLDRVVRDTTALGVTRFVAVQADRCVARYRERALARAERWRRIAVEAARQCGRGDVPAIEGLRPLSAAVLGSRSGRRLCLDPSATRGIDESLEDWTDTESVVLAVGPEGGWTSRERVIMSDAGFSLATLGPYSLRTELAATTALGALLARWVRCVSGPRQVRSC